MGMLKKTRERYEAAACLFIIKPLAGKVADPTWRH
jgi:hypothetical protein